MNDVLEWPLTIRRGREFSEYFGFRDNSDAAFDLTGYTVKAQLRDRAELDANLIVDFTIRYGDDDPTTGDVYLELTDTQTNAIEDRRGYYDILLTEDATGIDTTWVDGVVTLKGSVTDNA